MLGNIVTGHATFRILYSYFLFFFLHEIEIKIRLNILHEIDMKIRLIFLHEIDIKIRFNLHCLFVNCD